ncbi:MAG: hypothetical protein AB1511_10420 [Deinococcota bacterium]
MTDPADDVARLVARALPLQVAPPAAGQQHPVWHVPDEDPARVRAVEELALAAQQQPQAIRQAIAAYQQQHSHQYPQQPAQLTWGDGPPNPAVQALAELMLDLQARSSTPPERRAPLP